MLGEQPDGRSGRVQPLCAPELTFLSLIFPLRWPTSAPALSGSRSISGLGWTFTGRWAALVRTPSDPERFKTLLVRRTMRWRSALAAGLVGVPDAEQVAVATAALVDEAESRASPQEIITAPSAMLCLAVHLVSLNGTVCQILPVTPSGEPADDTWQTTLTLDQRLTEMCSKALQGQRPVND